MFRPRAVAVTRYRYRGTTIPTPWRTPAQRHEHVESRMRGKVHVRFGGRAGETDRPRARPRPGPTPTPIGSSPGRARRDPQDDRRSLPAVPWPRTPTLPSKPPTSLTAFAGRGSARATREPALRQRRRLHRHPRRGRVASKVELTAWYRPEQSRPYHPQTCGKVERLHQTLKSYLDDKTRPPPSQHSKPNSIPSPATTTRSGPTARSVGEPPYRPVVPG